NAINEWKEMLVHSIHKRLPLAFQKTEKQVIKFPCMEGQYLGKESSSSNVTLEKNIQVQPEFIVDWIQETIKDFSGHQVSSGYIKIQFNVEKSFFTDPNTNPYS
ncbi:25437_t:CDS:2, partial [Gigaspora rosea]